MFWGRTTTVGEVDEHVGRVVLGGPLKGGTQVGAAAAAQL